MFIDSIKQISVRIIATKKASECFPGDKTIDTITKSFSVIPWRECPVIGTYIGYFDSDKSKKDSVKLIYTPAEDGWGDFTLININCGCSLDTTIDWSYSRGGRAFAFDSDNTFYAGCKGPEAWLQLQGTDSLIINFTFRDNTQGNNNDATTWPIMKDRFIGVRKK